MAKWCLILLLARLISSDQRISDLKFEELDESDCQELCDNDGCINGCLQWSDGCDGVCQGEVPSKVCRGCKIGLAEMVERIREGVGTLSPPHVIPGKW